MRLKKLTIAGFKSFADRTVLHFDAGVTCIVGPNGCGKSNIADAFRWVLGEQSAKSMRGHKMEDVIFAGTNRRKPLDIAEISITLTDVQDDLPIHQDEVTITRRLHRNGNSEYLLNGQVVRLKDIQSLLLDSGIGGNTFAIFEQGKIERVIHYSPKERRYIFEEAAEIVRFLQRKREALKRLEEADVNLTRVKDIQREQEKQIRVLQSQAEKAKLFKENQDRLENLEKSSYVLRWEQLEKKWVAIEVKQKGYQELITNLQSLLSEQTTQQQQIKATLKTNEGLLKTKTEDYFKLSNQKEIQLREASNSQQRCREAKQREKKLQQELEELHINQQTRQKLLKEIHHKQNALEAEFNEAESKLTFQKDKVQLQERELAQLTHELQITQQKQMKHVQGESKLASECKEGEIRLENQMERKQQREERQAKLKAELIQVTQVLQEKRDHLQELSSRIDTHKDRLDQYEEEIKRLMREIEAKQQEAHLLQRRVMEQKARQQILLRMREDLEGFSSGSKQILQEAASPTCLFYQKVQPLYTYLNSNFAHILATILHIYAQTLVTETLKDFNIIVDFAQAHGLQDYSLLCLETIPPTFQHKKICSPFLEEMECNVVSNYLLDGFEEAKGYKEALEWLHNKPRHGIWCQESSYFDHQGIFFQVREQENHVFLREAELKTLEEEITGKEEQLHLLNQKINLLQQHKGQQQLERAELDKILRRDEMKLVEINFGLQRALADQNKGQEELALIEKDLVNLEQQLEQQQTALKQIQEKFQESKQAGIQIQEQLQILELERDQRIQRLRIQQQEQKEKGELYQELTEAYRKLSQQKSLLEVQEQDHEKQYTRLADERVEMQEIQAHMQAQERDLQQQAKELEEQIKGVDLERTHLTKELDKEQATLKMIENTLFDKQSLLNKSQEELNQLSVQAAHHQSSAQSLEYELQERHHLNLVEAKATVILDLPLEQLEKQIRTLRQALQAAGDVNLAAIEELNQHQMRYTTLNQQIADLTQSNQELLKIIAELDEQSQRRFKQTFEEIRHNFKKNFQILFNGGEADLQFTDTENILEAGIEIIAKPPGKQMRSISLLSGGEKCLTAVALLFAIFEVKPAPFCILDEIDAPLDDTNVERFTQVVKHFVEQCQFLIITHNKRTMAVGDVLFGVSMEEKGVSKLLSLQFSQAPAPEANLV